MTLTPPAPSIKVEQGVVRFMVAHYPDNANGTSPDVFDLTLYDEPCALARAAQLMSDAGYTGVCAITQMVASYVFPINV